MRMLLDIGASVSFTGVLTYRNAREVQEAARLAPDDRVMVETDAPFLSPDPHRGTRPCQPWMVSITARKLAEVRSTGFERFHEVLNENTAKFFGVR
jgi:TatD DNase family protein